MKLLCLLERDAVNLLTLAAAAGDAALTDVLRTQLTDPLMNATAAGRTILLRDEGGVAPFLMVSYDDRREADAVWASMTTSEETIEWP